MMWGVIGPVPMFPEVSLPDKGGAQSVSEPGPRAMEKKGSAPFSSATAQGQADGCPGQVKGFAQAVLEIALVGLEDGFGF